MQEPPPYQNRLVKNFFMNGMAQSCQPLRLKRSSLILSLYNSDRRGENSAGHLTESKSVQVVILKWSWKNRDKLPKVNV